MNEWLLYAAVAGSVWILNDLCTGALGDFQRTVRGDLGLRRQVDSDRDPFVAHRFLHRRGILIPKLGR